MKELVGLFILLYTLGQVVLDRERPEVLLERLGRYSKGKTVCATTGQYTAAEKASCRNSQK